MTGTSQFIKPHPDIRAGDAQRTFVLVRHGHHIDDKRVKFTLSQPPNPRKFSARKPHSDMVEFQAAFARKPLPMETLEATKVNQTLSLRDVSLTEAS